MPFDARHNRRQNPREKRPPKPLGQARLEEMALAYVARFATSAAKLEAYLKRKLRERGWEGQAEGTPGPDISALVARYVELGYIDDETYARAKAGGLLRRGYGPRRVNQALGAAGIAQDIRESLQASEGQERRAALALARKRRFGPFGTGAADRATREKQIAAMLRAGHALDSTRELLDAATVEAAEEWAAAVQEEEGS